jgi:hypothetical protein
LKGTRQAADSPREQGKILGEVRNETVGREILLAYFADKKPISQAVKVSVAEGLQRMLAPA